jgi:hypothetical protein
MNLQENIQRIREMMGFINEEVDDEYNELRREFDYYGSKVFENGHNGKKTDEAHYYISDYKKALSNLKKYHVKQNEIKYRIPEIRQVLREYGLTASKGVTSGQVRGFVEKLYDTYDFPNIMDFPYMLEIKTDDEKLNSIINHLTNLGINVSRERYGIKIRPTEQ